MAKSIEEQIEDLGKKQLGNTKYYTKTEGINSEIENALKSAPSKSGGSGTNYPDIKLFIETSTLRRIPVMIEVKGTKGSLVKFNDSGEIDNIKKDGTLAFANIQKYAVNGAVHYGNAVLDFTTSYDEVISVGMNGYLENGVIIVEVKAYYISKKNSYIIKLKLIVI